jgi:hypothetical protein
MIFWSGFCLGYLFLYIFLDVMLTLRRKRINLLEIEYLRGLDKEHLHKYLDFTEKIARGKHGNERLFNQKS